MATFTELLVKGSPEGIDFSIENLSKQIEELNGRISNIVLIPVPPPTILPNGTQLGSNRIKIENINKQNDVFKAQIANIQTEIQKRLDQINQLTNRREEFNQSGGSDNTITPPPTDSGFISSSNPQNPGLDPKILVAGLGLLFLV